MARLQSAEQAAPPHVLKGDSSRAGLVAVIDAAGFARLRATLIAVCLLIVCAGGFVVFNSLYI